MSRFLVDRHLWKEDGQQDGQRTQLSHNGKEARQGPHLAEDLQKKTVNRVGPVQNLWLLLPSVLGCGQPGEGCDQGQGGC